jgi:hypothetical protein
MTVVITLDVVGTHPESGIYLHFTTPIDSGFRIDELRDEKSGFDRFVETRLVPANGAVGVQRETTITVTQLHNFFGPRLAEWPGLVGTLSGRPGSLVAR